MRNNLIRWIKPIHTRFRSQKLDLFFSLRDKEPGGSLLDVGGGLGIANEFLRLYKAFDAVTVVNLQGTSPLPDEGVRVRFVLGDGCLLPFPPGAFDWVFSNAVIEHVGGWNRQKLFAQEIRRVARKGYFVATPNKYFPLEPHTLLPFYQFLPTDLQRHAVRLAPGYLREYEEIRLLSPRELRQLFPNARVQAMGFPVLGNNLVAFHCMS